VLLLALGGAAVALALKPASNNNNTPGALGTSSHPAATTPATTRPAVVVPPQQQCTDAIKANPRWVCLTKATISDSELRIEYTFSDAGVPFNISNGFHVHIYGANKDGSDPSADVMGAQVPSGQRGNWYLEDKQPSVHSAGTSDYDTVHGFP